MSEVRTVPDLFLSSVAKWGRRVALRKKQSGLWRDLSWDE
jgi:hypothetical protein